MSTKLAEVPSDTTLQEKTNIMKLDLIKNNAVVLSNVIELTTNVISNIAGKDISDIINNQCLSRDIVSNLVANRIKEKIIQ